MDLMLRELDLIRREKQIRVSASISVSARVMVTEQEEVEKQSAPGVAENIPEKAVEEAKPTSSADVDFSDDEALEVEEVRSVHAVVDVELSDVEEKETGTGYEEDDDDDIAVSMKSSEVVSIAAIVGRSDDGMEVEMDIKVTCDKKEAEFENGDSADVERWFTMGDYGLRGCWIWRSPHKISEITARVAGQKFLPRLRDPCEMAEYGESLIIHLGQM